MKVKKLDDIENKILLLRQFERDNNIKPLDINFIEEGVKINIDSNKFKLIKDIFRMSKKLPATNDELKKVYVGMIRHIFNSLEVILATRKTNIKNKNEKITNYFFNETLINQLFNLVFKLRIKNLDEILLKNVLVKMPINYINEVIQFDEKFDNEYLFGKR
jgi:hypothetical protein